LEIIKRKKKPVHLSDADGSADWFGATVTQEKNTLASRLIVFLLCFSLIISAVAYGAVDPWALGMQAIAAAVTGLLWLWDAWARRELRFNDSVLQIPLLGFLFLGAIQLLPFGDASAFNDVLKYPAATSLSFDPYATRMFLVQLAIYLIYFAAALTFVNTQKRMHTVTATLVAFGAIAAAFALIQGFNSDGKIYGTRETMQASPYGMFGNGHHFASMLLMLLSLTLGLLWARAVQKEMRVLHIFAAFVMCVGIIFSGSRGVLLSLFAVLLFLNLTGALKLKEKDAANSERGKLQKTLMLAGSAVLLIIVVFAAVSILGGGNSLTRAIRLSEPSGDVTNGRLHFWQTTFEVFKNNPIFGVGFDSLGVAYTRYDTWNGGFRIERAHNDYLQVLAESGIFGFAFLIWFLIALFRRGWDTFSSTTDRFRRGVALGALAGCLGAAVHSLFDFPLRTPANALVFLMLATLAVVNINYPKLHRKK
jgi:O-antigen ligase